MSGPYSPYPGAPDHFAFPSPVDPRDREDSQLPFFRRVLLLARKPRDAFGIFSRRERRVAAFWAYTIYFVVKFPILANGQIVNGALEKLGPDKFYFMVLPIALPTAYLSAGIFTVGCGVFLHILLNLIMRCGRTLEDALALPFLALGPQLYMLSELPWLFYDWGEYHRHIIMLWVRIGADVLSGIAFYHGLRVIFGLRRGQALATVISLTLLVVGLVVVEMIAMITS